MKFIFSLVLLLIGTTLFSQEWEYLTPLKTNTDIRGCSFLDEQRGMAVSATDGLVLKTLDGGMKWSRVWAPPVSSNLYDVEYVTEDTMFVCGNTGGLFRSVDGGNSWVDANPATAEWLYQVYFLNSQVGFACGFNGILLRTIDGGDSWQVIPSGTTNRLWSIDFVNDTTGYIAGWNGTVLKTIDAGENWSTLNTGNSQSYQSVCFVNDQTGWVCGSNGTVLKTSNGGTSWTVQVTGDPDQLYYVKFRSLTHGWAVGMWGMLYTTTNGGATWNTSVTLGNDDFYCGDYVSSGAAFIMGKRQIYKSTDNGASWTLIKNGVPRASMYDLWFSSDNVGTVVGAVGAVGSGSSQAGIIQTSNGGQTWETRQQGSSGGWYAVHFPTASVGYAASYNSLAKTTNGGVNWTYSSYTNSVSTMWFTSPEVGSIGANYGLSGLCTTSNGGSSFTCNGLQVPADMFFLDDQWGIAIPGVGANSYYRSYDGGLNWTTESGHGGRCVYFLDQDNGYIGSIGVILKTTDGGTTWTETFAGGGGDILAIRFYSNELGFFLSSYNQVYKTTNAGETWDIIIDNTVNMSSAINGFFTENYCYSSGAAGDVYRTELGCGSFSTGNIIGDDEWCENETGILATEQIPGATSYVWTLPNGWTGASNSFIIQPIAGLESGLVSVTVTNACGLQASTSYDVNVTPQVEPILQIDGPASICSVGNYVYSVPEDLAATEYTWQTSVGIVATEQGNTLNVTSATDEGLIFVQSSNVCGTSEWAQLEVNLLAPPEVFFVLDDDSLCSGTMTTLTGGTPEGGVYSGPGVDQGVLNLEGAEVGQIELSYTYTAPGGCTNTATESVYVISFFDHPANLNGDCTIDGNDVDVVLSNFGCLNNCNGADLDNDGIVGVYDIMILMGFIGL